MKPDLLQPSLREGETYVTRSYNIDYFMCVGFLGGIFPVLVLATQNARWLGFDRKKTYILLAAGLIFMIVGTIACGAFQIAKAQGTVSRVVGITVALLYKTMLQKKYRVHMYVHGHTKRILYPAIGWIVLGKLLESFLYTLGGGEQ
ncbi:hypothetical protein [Aneurinibacillus uraniidurans]|uniref:hypothetical protein n=1 Tax=Aneurinibacillus uraniidurans TaxID=2966586 RepID=UPI00234A1E5C|nr:hypothetical protein [Aneurinibacillus sp. B1]WCN37956.1 hypothetical protein PO771_00520 [Aneurinibacillus sp. B1]